MLKERLPQQNTRSCCHPHHRLHTTLPTTRRCRHFHRCRWAAGALSLTGLMVLPLAQAVFGRVTRRLSAGLLLMGLLAAGASSIAPGLWPYSCA